jgi:hypothetical protein
MVKSLKIIINICGLILKLLRILERNQINGKRTLELKNGIVSTG